MNPVRVVRLGEAGVDYFKEAIMRVFFETALRQSFDSEADKMNYAAVWLAPYLKRHADHVFVALDTREQVLGYLTGCLDSLSDLDILNSTPSLKLFEDCLHAFPAHLHVNVSLASQGQGVGGRLMDSYLRYLARLGGGGVHVITAVDARNVNFYLSNGFRILAERKLNESLLGFYTQRVASN